MNRIKGLITLIMITVVIAGCQKETFMPGEGTKDLGTEIELTMCASMSDVVIPTRGLSEAEENVITRLDVLVFKADDTFAYTVQANTPTVGGSNLTYTVRLKKSTSGESYKLVLLANLEETAIAALKAITASTAKEAALATITFAPVTTWNTGVQIPMWADYPTTAVVSTGTTNNSFGTTKLIRSLARINVTNAATTTFTLTNVWVYNSANKARVAPVLTNYDRPSAKVTAPSIASGAGITAVYGKAVTAHSLQREIYIGESEDKAVGDAAAVCLVLEGTFGGKKNFYRVDMVGSNGQTPLDILRNHTYNVNITKVGGSGYGTKEDAFNSMPINMTIELKVWDDAALNDITSDGQYTLAVDKAAFKVDGQAGTETINYSTDYPNGITVTINDGWLTTAQSTGNTIGFSYSINPSITASRTGSITITAGRIHKKIAITQAMRVVANVGMFGGTIKGSGTETDPYQFSQPLYVQTSDESTAPWDNASLSLINTTSSSDGRGNTWILRAPNFVAANLCFKKNTGVQQASKDALVWYLPAQKQLIGIWVTHSGSDASFAEDSYWSSSECSSAGGWCVGLGDGFGNGFVESYSKAYSTRVRCVREVMP